MKAGADSVLGQLGELSRRLACSPTHRGPAAETGTVAPEGPSLPRCTHVTSTKETDQSAPGFRRGSPAQAGWSSSPGRSVFPEVPGLALFLERGNGTNPHVHLALFLLWALPPAQQTFLELSRGVAVGPGCPISWSSPKEPQLWVCDSQNVIHTLPPEPFLEKRVESPSRPHF